MYIGCYFLPWLLVILHFSYYHSNWSWAYLQIKIKWTAILVCWLARLPGTGNARSPFQQLSLIVILKNNKYQFIHSPRYGSRFDSLNALLWFSDDGPRPTLVSWHSKSYNSRTRLNAGKLYREMRHQFCGGVRCLTERRNRQSFRLRSYVLLQYCAGLDFRTSDHVTRFPRGNLRTRSCVDEIAPWTCSVVYALNHVYWCL